MATVNGLSKERMLEIEAASVVDGDVVGDDLMLTRHDGSSFYAGNVRGPKGDNAMAGDRWSSATTYAVNNTVGYAGRLYTCIQANTGKCPYFYNNYWKPVNGTSTETWYCTDPYFAQEDLDAWEMFWRNGTVTSSITTTVGEFETGQQGLKLVVGTASSQRLYERNENIVKDGETVTLTVRAKLSAAVTGVTISAGLFQAPKDGNPEPFGSSASEIGAAQGNQALTNAWQTFIFTMVAAGGKQRARANFLINQAAGTGDVTVLIDRAETSKLSYLWSLKADKSYVDSQDSATLLSAKSFASGLWPTVELAGGVDLNTLTTPGFYSQSATAEATSGTNYPTAIAGLLEVYGLNIAGQMVWQRYTPYGLYGDKIYMRSFYNNAWSAWKMLLTRESADSGWVNLTPASGWASSPSGAQKTAASRIINDVVYFRGVLTGSLTAATTTTIATVTAAHRPTTNPSNFQAAMTTGGFVGWANITDLGALSVHFKTPYATGTATIELSSMSYALGEGS